MDPRRFDQLVRFVATPLPRRGLLAALLAALSVPLMSEELEAKRRGRGSSKRKAQGKKRKQRQREQARAEAAAGCCSSGTCSPGQGKNLTKCCFEGQNLSGTNFKGSNLTQANFAGANLTSAKFQSSNLTGACLVDATITGANFESASLSGVIRCRTKDGANEDNSGCDRGTPCCPTCDGQHPCPGGARCCGGRCVSGNCCNNADCLDPAAPVCRNNTCSPCTQDSQCGNGTLCCDGTCVNGNCCNNADCSTPDAPVCRNHTCSPCTEDNQCGNGTVCCQGRCQAGAWAPQTRFGSLGAGADQFNIPRGVAISEDTKTVWVADENHGRISVWTRPNATSTNWTHQVNFGTAGEGDDQFDRPSAVAVSPDTLTVWVADTINHRISVWTRPNASSTDWEHQATFGNGPGNRDRDFAFPSGVAVSPDTRTVWVGDGANGRISVWGLVCPAS